MIPSGTLADYCSFVFFKGGIRIMKGYYRLKNHYERKENKTA
jgi:hypothetical protein